MRINNHFLGCLEDIHEITMGVKDSKRHIKTFDGNDFKYTPNTIVENTLFNQMEIRDQGPIGSCTANALASCIESAMELYSNNNNLNWPKIKISRLYQYYNSRKFESRYRGLYFDAIAPMSMEGSTRLGALVALDKFGATPEDIDLKQETIYGPYDYKGWRYDITRQRYAPPPEAYRLAFEADDMDGVNTGNSMMENDLKGKNPYALIYKNYHYENLQEKAKGKDLVNLLCHEIACGIPIYTAVLLDQIVPENGWIYMPPKNSKIDGGHAICIVGYGPYNKEHPNKNYFKFINSWGEQWGQKGYGFFEEDYITDPKLCDTLYSVWIGDKPNKILENNIQTSITFDTLIKKIDDVTTDLKKTPEPDERVITKINEINQDTQKLKKKYE